MGRPPSNGGPAFRFTAPEVAEMEAILQGHNNTMPSREVLVSLAGKFSESVERKGKIAVQMKQVWNWFQNRRYAIRAKTTKVPGKLAGSPIVQVESTPPRNVPQTIVVPAPTLVGPLKRAPENPLSEFEAKSGRDGAWYDVATFLSHRSVESGDPEVLVRFAGFGSDEDEWVNVRRNIRPRSLPCESSECVAVLPGDLILCFQEGKEQALYFDAHVLDTQRRRHDVRGCRCRFLVRYDHDQSEEIVQLRKICRRPETDHRLLQLHAANEAASMEPSRSGMDSVLLSGQTISFEATQRLLNKDATIVIPNANANINVHAQTSTQEARNTVTNSAPAVFNAGNHAGSSASRAVS
ncbi:protein SAWADEE HOMEODOMAIN HOMOLOG 2-like [Cucurbita moschata]|uniref:Protein SAWADEE HOMEODOMAIN HOMOLOG 2-like n=1 Tax=Cucurbita moschata TaxID=3662 RepID=A0A6J1FNY7_CUCMO|nr:protein SAWADEE HOMEODOMAIN HOMOLOG 2-like [Cucurbita moschata]XP_022941620.1 protein SAWADEE HOMEODOMAIN HOMOLOG 2-like [Cucurbita moschata]XP_022941621.1 protein SAWADEE HOMEODOMAIN HOMOLOG 2-like [Cucurbita moschata]XP_022941622.1 protein SAWADEE HOMEODOMAIN HOMOLOG 2-like [Cucurbita moschata]